MLAFSFGESVIAGIDHEYNDSRFIDWINEHVYDPTPSICDAVNWILGGHPRYFRDGHFDKKLVEIDSAIIEWGK
jgi:hypothetical protein